MFLEPLDLFFCGIEQFGGKNGMYTPEYVEVAWDVVLGDQPFDEFVCGQLKTRNFSCLLPDTRLAVSSILPSLFLVPISLII